MRRFGMRRLGILALIFVILLGGGAISSNLLSSDLTIQQTTDPNGDALTATPDQAADFILIVGFIVMNVIGAGLTLTLVLWLLNHQVTAVQRETQAPS